MRQKSLLLAPPKVLTYDVPWRQKFLTEGSDMADSKRNARTRAAVFDDAGKLSAAAEQCRIQAFVYKLDSLETIATKLDCIAAELRATEIL